MNATVATCPNCDRTDAVDTIDDPPRWNPDARYICTRCNYNFTGTEKPTYDQAIQRCARLNPPDDAPIRQQNRDHIAALRQQLQDTTEQ